MKFSLRIDMKNMIKSETEKVRVGRFHILVNIMDNFERELRIHKYEANVSLHLLNLLCVSMKISWDMVKQKKVHYLIICS